MTKKELAEKYFNENPEPIQDLCPEIRQHWMGSKGIVFWSNKTGKREQTNLRDAYAIRRIGAANPDVIDVTPRGESYSGFYLRYVAELDAMEFATIFLPVDGRGKDGVRVNWKFTVRMLEFRNDMTVYRKYQNVYCCGPAFLELEPDGKYYHKSVVSLMHTNHNAFLSSKSFAEIKKYDSDFDGHYNYMYWVEDWYKKRFAERKKSDKAKEILSYEMEDMEPEIESGYSVFAKILDNNYMVLRIFRLPTYRNEEGKVTEVTRIFISNKGKVTVVDRGRWGTTHGWEITSASPNIYENKVKMLNPETFTEWNPTKYVMCCVVTEDGQSIDVKKLVNVLRHPIMEQLVKAGYPNWAKVINRDSTIAANLKHYFGVEKETKATLYKLLGVNKNLLQMTELLCFDNGRYGWVTENANIIREIKWLYGRNDISDLSTETLSLIMPVIKEACSYHGLDRVLDTERNYWYYRNHEDREPITDEKRKFFMRLCRIEAKTPNMSVTRYWNDTKQIWGQLIAKPNIDITDFDNVEDLRRIHDALVEYRNAENLNREAAYNERKRQELEQCKKTFEKLQDERIEKYEADGKDFCIRVPHELNEIIEEGNALHHCVGGYVNRHAMGDTNIIFLRKVTEENVPFYTIEVRNNKVIQIHGKYNRWLGNDPEAIPFVYKWLTDRGISFEKRMLLNLGSGYAPSMSNLDETHLYNVA